jgi:uncharacterized membrane protein
MTTLILPSQNFTFQITIYRDGNRGIFYANTFMCALKQGAHAYFSKNIFWKQIRMNLLFLLFDYRNETPFFGEIENFASIPLV